MTICTKGRECFFGEIQNEDVILSEMWKIVKEEIKNHVRENILIDSYIIMPNHIHAIIVIQNVGCDCIAPWTNIVPHINMATKTETKTDIPQHKNSIQETLQPENGTIQPENGTMQSFPTLSRVIRGLKWRITSRIQNECEDWYTFTWQKSFYDVIIRNDEQLDKTRQYICDNPKNWNTDTNNV